MKKNKMMRLASVLLVAVMLTMSIVSGTYAKYVTTGEASDSARVAKFGVIITSSGKLFDYTYKQQADGNVPGGTAADATPYTALTVEASENVVAPGTKSDDANPLKLSVTGTSEVDVKVTFDIANAKDVFLKKNTTKLPDMTTADETDTFVFDADDEDYYYPIVYTLKGALVKKFGDANKFDSIVAETFKYDAATSSVSGTLADLKDVFDVLNAGYDGSNGFYVDAGTNLATVSADSNGVGELTLTWVWEFGLTDAEKSAVTTAAEAEAESAWGDWFGNYEGTETDNPLVYNGTEYNYDSDEDNYKAAYAADALAAAEHLRDQKDTLLGDLAAKTALKPADIILTEGSDYDLTASISLTVTVTQVD